MKPLREIVGKPLNINIEFNPNDKRVADDEKKFTKNMTDGAQVFDPLGLDNDYNKDVKKDETEKPNGGKVDPLKKIKEAIDEAVETLDEDDLELFFEELDQLDEISKQKLGDYIKGASSDMYRRGRDQSLGIIAARERGKGFASNADRKALEKHANKTDRREKYVDKATDRLTKEDVDQIDEISKARLGDYIKGASDDMYRRGRERQSISNPKHPDFEPDGKKRDAHSYKSGERHRYIKKATDRLTKEDVDQIDELNKKTLKSYVKKATTSAQRHWDKGDREEDKAMSTDGNKYPEKQARHQAAASGHYHKWANRDKGLTRAKERLKEAVDELSELYGKGSLENIKKHHGQEAEKSYSNAERDDDDHEDHVSKGIDHEDRYTRAKALIRLRNAHKETRAAKADASATRYK